MVEVSYSGKWTRTQNSTQLKRWTYFRPYLDRGHILRLLPEQVDTASNTFISTWTQYQEPDRKGREGGNLKHQPVHMDKHEHIPDY